jgi:predicted lipid-binding transport protein (Tim44 family)
MKCKTCKDCEHITKEENIEQTKNKKKIVESYSCEKFNSFLDNFETCPKFKQRKKVVGYKKKWKVGLIFGLIYGLTGGLIVGLIFGLIAGLIIGLIVGLIFSLIIGLEKETIYKNSNIDKEIN